MVACQNIKNTTFQLWNTSCYPRKYRSILSYIWGSDPYFPTSIFDIMRCVKHWRVQSSGFQETVIQDRTKCPDPMCKCHVDCKTAKFYTKSSCSDDTNCASPASDTCFLRVTLRGGLNEQAPPLHVVIIGFLDDRKGLVIQLIKKAITSMMSQNMFSSRGWQCGRFWKVLSQFAQ